MLAHVRLTLAFSTLTALASPALAAPPRLRVDPRIDVPIVAGTAVAWITSELLKSKLAPAACRWCDRDAAGNDTLNGVDEGMRSALKWSSIGSADTASNIAGFIVVPGSALGLAAYAAYHDGADDGFWRDPLVIVEAAFLAANANQLTKFVVSRERPFVHVLSPDEKANTTQPSDNNLSFYSGHTSLAFSLAVASGTVASMRRLRLAPVIWATGLTLATGIGYLRIAADRHYFTDVSVGALLGSAFGFVVPYVFHRPGAEDEASRASLSATPLPGGARIDVAYRF